MHNRTYLLALTAAFALIASTAGDAAAQDKPSIAILGLEVSDAGGSIDVDTTQLANKITEALRKRPARQAGPYRLAPHSDKDLLEMKLLSGCNDEGENCMAKIGADLDADMLMYGNIQRLPDGYQVTLTLLNVKKKSKQATTAKIQNSDAKSKSKIDDWSRKIYNQVTGVPEQGDLHDQGQRGQRHHLHRGRRQRHPRRANRAHQWNQGRQARSGDRSAGPQTIPNRRRHQSRRHHQAQRQARSGRSGRAQPHRRQEKGRWARSVESHQLGSSGRHGGQRRLVALKSQ